MHTDDDNLTPEMKALFDEAAREAGDAGARVSDVPPAGLKAAMWKSIESRIAPPPVAPIAPAASAGAVRMAALTGFAAGILSGIAGTLVVAQAMFAPVYVPVMVPIERPGVPIVQLDPTPSPARTPPVVVKETGTQVAVAPTPTPGDGEYSTERAWLDAAYRALERGEIDEAMEALEAARLRYPEGSLSEEREAIGVHVLISRGEIDSARLAVETFRKRHPASTFLSKIEERFREMEANP